MPSAGLAMWVHNLGCEEAQYLDTWQNSDPGILNMVEALFKMPVETVAAAMQIDVRTAQVLSEDFQLPILLDSLAITNGLVCGYIGYCGTESVMVCGFAMTNHISLLGRKTSYCLCSPKGHQIPTSLNFFH